MPDPSKSDVIRSAAKDEDRLAYALISRGLVARDEVLQCRAKVGIVGTQALLHHLVEARFLTQSQANRLLPELPSIVNQMIPGYEMMEKLGGGFGGLVFRAKQLSMNRLVAVKVLSERLASKPEYLERFVREGHTAAKLSHNNIVQAIDVGSVGAVHYLVMELVEGKTVKDELDTGRVYEEKEALQIAVQIARALQHAHRRGLIHRDVKPANILVTPEGVAKLADLGFARETADKKMGERERDMIIGTPYYMSPEQVEGQITIDGRADMYSLGATLYHMVTGRPPFPHKKTDEVLKAHLKEELTPPDHLVTDLSAGLGAVVETMMAKKPIKRYQRADDLIVDLECLLNDEPPKLLGKRGGQQSALEELAEEEVEEPEPEEEEPAEEEDRYDEPSKEETKRLIWRAALGSALVISIILNIILLIFRPR